MKRSFLCSLLVGQLALASLLPAAAPSFDSAGATRKINATLRADWEKHKLQANPPAADEVFVRRIYLDITGRIPTHRETEAFLSNTAPDKRTKLIDQLLNSEGYVEHMFNYWADILRAQSNGTSRAITGAAYTNFIKESIRQNKPYDQFVRDMIGSQGVSWENGAIGYYMRDRGMPLDNMANTVRIFLGTRIECAQCHDHPFDKWSQMQFYQMAAFTYGMQTTDYTQGTMGDVSEIIRERSREKLKAYRVKRPTEADQEKLRAMTEQVRKDGRYVQEALGDVRDLLRYTSTSLNEKRPLLLPHDYQYSDAKPKSKVTAGVMMGNPITQQSGESNLEAYARWMTSPENPRFTNVIANRLWKKVFGMGLVEPVDELMDSTLASSPELMKTLEDIMRDSGYDQKAFLRVLFNTEAYQRSVTREEVVAGVPYYFTGPLLRRMSAEQMWDSFVALINPTPDQPNPGTVLANEKRIRDAKKLSDALNTLSPEEMLQGAEIAAQTYRQNMDKVNALSKDISAARAAKDKDLIKKLSAEASKYSQAGRRAVNNHIIVPAVQKLAAKQGGKSVMASSPSHETSTESPSASMMGDASMMMNASEDIRMDQIRVPGYDPAEISEAAQQAENTAQRQVFEEEAEYYQIPQKDRKAYYKYRQTLSRNWQRASHIGSPAPRGHYLREFGQSDRETIENANYDASVPQALALMNSQLLPQMMERFSQLMLSINRAPYENDKVEVAYMTLLSRKPTDRELAIWAKASDQGLTQMEDLVYALINSQQFIFIQ